MTGKERREKNRKLATDYVDSVNSATFCVNCGKQPIEWHGEHHPKNPNVRISSLRTQGASLQRIKEEMEMCVPLCRSCHMKEDGRMDALKNNQPIKRGDVITQPKPCRCCGKMTKPMRNNMCVSCDNHHSGRRVRKTQSCDGCCAPPQIESPNPAA